MRLIRLLKKDMTREVQEWVREGVIESAQGEAILARYGARLAGGRNTSLGYYVLTALAALFVGLALTLIVSHNWDEIPRLVRMMVLCLMTLAVNLQGMRLMLAGWDKAGVLWLFFGSICFGTTIMLIAQIYHLGEHFPDGIFYWALGALPLIFITRSRLNALFCLALATIWMMVEAGSDFFPLSYPLFALAAGWLAWVRRDSALLLMGSLAGIIIWLNLFIAWIEGDLQKFRLVIDQIPANIGMGFVLSGLAWWLMRRSDNALRDYGQVVHLWLLRGAIAALLLLSFEDTWRELAREQYILGLLAPLFVMLSGAVGFALARPSGAKAFMPLFANSTYFFLAFLWIHLGNVHADWLAAATNLMLVITGVWLIRRGIDDAVTQFFYTGVGVLLLTALLRYFDLIGDYIGGAVLFMIGAAVLFGAARYWRARMMEQEVDDV